MNKEQAAKRLGISTRTLDRRLADGVELGLLERHYKKASNGMQALEFSPDDIKILAGLPKRQRSSEALTLHTQNGLEKSDGHSAMQLIEALTKSLTLAQVQFLPDERLYRLKYLAQSYDIPRSRLFKAIREGKLKAFRDHPYFGRGYRIKRSDFLKFLEGEQ